MNLTERRLHILQTLSSTQTPLTGTELANTYGVTRPIIVGDIASLRNEGYPIISTPKGYCLLVNAQNKIKRVIVCKHDGSKVKDELLTIVKNGGSVLNTGIEHSIYGTIEASLTIHTIKDIQEFMDKIAHTPSTHLLSNLSDGVHTHLIEAANIDEMERIVEKLDTLGVLYK